MVALVIAAPLAVPYVKQHKREIIQHPLVIHLIPTYRSLRKISDVLFLHHMLFAKTEYPAYSLSISPKNVQRLNDPLPQNPFDSAARLTDESKVWVPATFTHGAYSDNVKVRYRGNQANHWGNYKKSYLIKFSKDNLFQGQRELTLVIPSDRRYFAMTLNNYRAKKLGLLVPEEKLVSLNLNGADHGVYLAFERWSQEWIEKQPMSALSVAVNTIDLPNDIVGLPSLHTEAGLPYWKGINTDEPEAWLEPLRALTELVEHTDDATFERLAPRLIDIEQFYGRDIISILSGSFHNAGPVAGANNLVMYFDATEGRFKPIPYNSVFFPPEDGFDGQPTDLQLRLWAIPEFKAARDAAFHEYVAAEAEDDKAFLSDWMDENKDSFYADFAKDETNLSFWRKMKSLTAAMHDYFNDPFDILNRTYEFTGELAPLPEGELTFTDSFVYLLDTIKTPSAFVAEHPQFRLEGDQLILPAGFHRFTETLIVPADTALTIKPGAIIALGDDASFVSYSPVMAIGTNERPIVVQAAGDDAWGVFAVVNTETASSSFVHNKFSGGGETIINGVYFSGMLALHNADGQITDSEIRGTTGDDGVNVKSGSVVVTRNRFVENSSDGIDVDYPRPGTVVADNYFIDNKGDCIDLSWSEIPVTNNMILGCGDKGISVGERSAPTLDGNIIVGTATGIAVKDQSNTVISNTVFLDNRIAVSAYQKKNFFGGGVVTVRDSTDWGSQEQTFSDEVSTITIESLTRAEPAAESLPAAVLQYLQLNEVTQF